jgi:hypothetical protein
MTRARSGPSSAKPSANEAWSVTVKRLLAASSWPRSTSRGIIAASAGAKKVVMVEMAMLRVKISSRLRSICQMARKRRPRRTLETTRMSRRSKRST